MSRHQRKAVKAVMDSTLATLPSHHVASKHSSGLMHINHICKAESSVLVLHHENLCVEYLVLLEVPE